MSTSKTGSRFQSYRNFQATGKDSNYLLLLSRYFDSVQDDMKKLLRSDKKMSKKDARNFMDKLFTMENKRMLQMKDEVADCYAKGFSTTDCAKQLLEKYYNITKVNKYKAPMEQEEVTEVTEKVTTSFYHFKNVSSSLFWNFISHINKLDIKFIFDTSRINKLDNSLNHKDFVLYMETPVVTDKEVEYEFGYSKLLSSVLKVIKSNQYDGNGIKFFIAIDKKSQLRFGYLLNGKRYTFGGFSYKSADILKLAPFINASTGDINFKTLSKKFKSIIQNMWNYRSILSVYLHKYDNINTYMVVLNNKLTLVVESLGNEDVLNKRYIEHILQTNIGKRLKIEDMVVSEKKYNQNTHYYINIK